VVKLPTTSSVSRFTLPFDPATSAKLWFDRRSSLGAVRTDWWDPTSDHLRGFFSSGRPVTSRGVHRRPDFGDEGVTKDIHDTIPVG